MLRKRNSYPKPIGGNYCMKQAITTFFSILLMSALALAGAAQKPAAKRSGAMGPNQSALNAITTDGIMSHIKTLASDEFEGRAPGTRGEELSISYLTDQMKKLGL